MNFKDTQLSAAIIEKTEGLFLCRLVLSEMYVPSFRLCLTFVEVVILAYKTLFSGLQIKNFTRRQLFAAQRTSKATKVVHFITCFANKVLVVNLFATPPTFGPKTPEKKKLNVHPLCVCLLKLLFRYLYHFVSICTFFMSIRSAYCTVPAC